MDNKHYRFSSSMLSAFRENFDLKKFETDTIAWCNKAFGPENQGRWKLGPSLWPGIDIIIYNERDAMSFKLAWWNEHCYMTEK